MVKTRGFYAKLGRAGCSSPDPRALPLTCVSKRMAGQGLKKRKKQSTYKQPLERIKENKELTNLENVSGGYKSEKSQHSPSGIVDNTRNICLQNPQETRESMSLKKSDTSPGISLPTSVSLVDYDDSSCESESEFSASTSTLRSFFPELFRDKPEPDLSCETIPSARQRFINKNSTLLETSKAMDIDLVPEPENVSHIKHFPKSDQLKPVESGKSAQSVEHPVKPHVSTSVSGKNVYRITKNRENTPTHHRESYFICPGRLKQKFTYNGKPVCSIITAPQIIHGKVEYADEWKLSPNVHTGENTQTSHEYICPIFRRRLKQKFTLNGKPVCCIITAPLITQIYPEKGLQGVICKLPPRDKVQIG